MTRAAQLLQGVASRDIKLENTLLDSSPRPLVKICDFGYSKHEKFQSAPGSRVGTPAYLAPEVIMTTKGQTYDGKVIEALVQRILIGAQLFHDGHPSLLRLTTSDADC